MFESLLFVEHLNVRCSPILKCSKDRMFANIQTFGYSKNRMFSCEGIGCLNVRSFSNIRIRICMLKCSPTPDQTIHTCYFDVGDGCWWRNVLVTILRCWLRRRCGHQHSFVFNINVQSFKRCYQHLNVANNINVTMDKLNIQNLVTSMLVTDVGDQMCCWQVWDVGDRLNTLRRSPT